MLGIPFLRALLARQARARAPRRKAILGVEALESRQLLATNCNVISGYAYLDLNDNGLFDPGEPAIANSTIQLRNSQGAVIATAQTDATGFYQFDKDPTLSNTPQTLTRTATFPETPTDWTQAEAVQQFDPSLGTLTSVDIIANAQVKNQQKVESLDNIPQTITASVSGNLTLNGPGIAPLVVSLSASQKFNASAFDGTIDFGGTSGHDFGLQTIPGTQTMTVTDPAALAAFSGTGNVSFNAITHITSTDTGSGNLVTQVTTTALANVQIVYHYIPTNCLTAGNYTLVQTTQPPGLLEGFESSNGQVIPGSVGTDTIHVTLTGNATSVQNNFGDLPPAGLAGCVYVDQNNNGAKDNGEPGLSGVNITLTGVNDLGQQVTLTQTTDASGNYQFEGLRPGTYALTEGPVAGYFPGMSTIGTLGGTLGSGQFTQIKVATGAEGANYCFAEVPPGSLAGCVFVDQNNNGMRDGGEPALPGVVVTLTGATNSGQQINVSQTTDANGNFQFTNLQPGTYQLAQAPVSGYTNGKDSLGSLGGVVGNGQFTHIVLPANTSGANYCFALVPPGNIAGCVFVDMNNNGVKDNGEISLAGVTVTLTGLNNQGQQVSLTQTTDASGNYQFTNLLPGTYTLVQSSVLGYFSGKETIGSLGGTAGNGQISGINLTSGQNGANYCFGVFPPGSLSGCVFFDDNNNGIHDANEAGIPGDTITLKGTNDLNQTIFWTTVTDANGNFSIGNLRPGNYSLIQTPVAGLIDGLDQIGSLGGTEPINDQFFVALGVGQNGTDYCFGERQPTTVPKVIVTPPPPFSKWDLIALNVLEAINASSAQTTGTTTNGVTVTPTVHTALKAPTQPLQSVFNSSPWWWMTHHS